VQEDDDRPAGALGLEDVELFDLGRAVGQAQCGRQVTARLGAELAAPQVERIHVGRVGSLVVGGVERFLVVVEVDLGFGHRDLSLLAV